MSLSPGKVLCEITISYFWFEHVRGWFSAPYAQGHIAAFLGRQCDVIVFNLIVSERAARRMYELVNVTPE